MISGANMELYVQLLHEYIACPIHPVHPVQANPTDNEPQLSSPPQINALDGLPDVPPEPKGLPDISPESEEIEVSHRTRTRTRTDTDSFIVLMFETEI